jgi:hypothetical protein
MTAVVFAAPFLLWAPFVFLPKRRLRAVFLLATIGAVGLAVNADHLLRNEYALWRRHPAVRGEVTFVDRVLNQSGLRRSSRTRSPAS